MRHAIALSVLALPAVASGSVETFRNRADWRGFAGNNIVTESFERRADLGLVGSPSTYGTGLGVSLVEGNVTATVELDDPADPVLSNTTPGGRQYLRFGSLHEQGGYEVQFSIPGLTRVFGFDFVEWEPGLSSGPTGADIDFFRGGELVSSTFVESDATLNGDVSFLGFTSTFEFDRVRVRIASFTGGSADITAFDEVSFAVPGPSAAVVLGLCGLAGVRRRR